MRPRQNYQRDRRKPGGTIVLEGISRKEGLITFIHTEFKYDKS